MTNYFPAWFAFAAVGILMYLGFLPDLFLVRTYPLIFIFYGIFTFLITFLISGGEISGKIEVKKG